MEEWEKQVFIFPIKPECFRKICSFPLIFFRKHNTKYRECAVITTNSWKKIYARKPCEFLCTKISIFKLLKQNFNFFQISIIPCLFCSRIILKKIYCGLPRKMKKIYTLTIKNWLVHWWKRVKWNIKNIFFLTSGTIIFVSCLFTGKKILETVN